MFTFRALHLFLDNSLYFLFRRNSLNFHTRYRCSCFTWIFFFSSKLYRSRNLDIWTKKKTKNPRETIGYSVFIRGLKSTPLTPPTSSETSTFSQRPPPPAPLLLVSSNHQRANASSLSFIRPRLAAFSGRPPRSEVTLQVVDNQRLAD